MATKTETISREEAELIEAMQAEATAAPEPGTLSSGDVVNTSANEDVPLPMVAREVSSAGYVYVYDRVTGDPSRVNRNMLPYVLKKIRPETGKLVFTLIDPGFRPMQGTFKCDLHPESTIREAYDKLGVPTCKKQNLKTEWDKLRHMQRRHPSEFAMIKEQEYAKDEADRKEQAKADREFQQKILEMLMTQQTEK